MFIVDAHLDLAYNALKFDRDLRLSLAEVRQREAGLDLPNGQATVAFPDLLRAGVGLVFGTLFVAPLREKNDALPAKLTYRSAAEAHAQAMAQLDYYHRLADETPYLRLVKDLAGLSEVVQSHEPGNEPLLGIVPLMEGADPIRTPEEAETWFERGLRIIGPAWDDTRYAGGAWRGEDGLTTEGHQLLEVMAGLGYILDLTHLSEKASFEALDRYPGPVVATHSNVRALVPGQRQLSDEQIRQVVERDGVIGTVLFNRFLITEYERGAKHSVRLSHVIAHIDHICQLAGDAAHVGIGSDFDGGFGVENIPAELDSAIDLPLLAKALLAYGYNEPDVMNIMGGNWLRLLRSAWQ